jgi:hypothetical protein
MWGKFVKVLEWIGHGSTATQVAGWFGLPVTGIAGWAMTFFGSAAEGWSVSAGQAYVSAKTIVEEQYRENAVKGVLFVRSGKSKR